MTGETENSHDAERSRPFIWSASCMLAVMLGCGGTDVSTAPSGNLDLMDRLQPDSVGVNSQRRMPVVRRGRREEAVVLIAPAVSRASVSGWSGPARLEGWITPVFNLGDGLRMEIALAARGTRAVLFSQYLDPGRSSQSRDWIPLSLSLTSPDAPEWDLEFRVSGGPQGDLVGDWLAISRLRLVSVQ